MSSDKVRLFQEVIATRRSIRSFKSTPVSELAIAKIIQAGYDAPTAGNLQNTQFIVVRNNKEKLEGCFWGQDWVLEAPVIIVVCSDDSLHEKEYGSDGKKYSIESSAAAAENMLLMAHAQGLGSCWLGAFDENKVKSALKIPDLIRVVALLPIGHPAMQPERPRKKLITEITYIENYGGGSKITDFNLTTKAEGYTQIAKQAIQDERGQVQSFWKKIFGGRK